MKNQHYYNYLIQAQKAKLDVGKYAKLSPKFPGKQYFNEKVKKLPEIELQDYESTEPTQVDIDAWGDMMLSWDNSTTTSTSTVYYGGTSSGHIYYHPLSFGNYYHKPSIGEDPEMIAPDSMDKTFIQYYEEFSHENGHFGDLAKKQSFKLKEEYKHEQLAYQKQQELEQQKADMPIYAAEFATARVFLQYYANLALQKPTPHLKPEQIMNVSKYLAATISCELRHRKRKCSYFWSRAIHLWDMLDDWCIDDNKDRRSAGKRFLSEAEEWDNFMVEQYLKLGAYIFGGSWEGGFGGWPWASVAWYAGDWVHSALTKKGEIPIMLWEKMLNAAHNNGRWMNKLGMGNVMGVLNMGANADPHFIIDIAKKALGVENPNDFKRIIEKWTSCDLPGEKNKLELPNPGVVVETSRYRTQKKSYLAIIKKQEAEEKDKAKLVLDAPDKAPIEMGVVEEAVEIKGYDYKAGKEKSAAEIAAHLKKQKAILEAMVKAEETKPKPQEVKKKVVIPTAAKPIEEKSSIFVTGIKLPWKGSMSPLQPPKSHEEALQVFTNIYHDQAFHPGKPAVEETLMAGPNVMEVPKEIKLDFDFDIEKLKAAMPSWMATSSPIEKFEGESFVEAMKAGLPESGSSKPKPSKPSKLIVEELFGKPVESPHAEFLVEEVPLPPPPTPGGVVKPTLNAKKPGSFWVDDEPPKLKPKSKPSDGFTQKEISEGKSLRAPKGGTHEQVAGG